MPTAILIAILIKMAEMWRRSRIENPETETQGSRSQVASLANRQISVQTSETNYQYQAFNDQLSTQEEEMPQDKIMMILLQIQQDIRDIKKVIELINQRLDRQDEQNSMVNTRLFTIQQHLVNRNQGFIPYANRSEQSQIALRSQQNTKPVQSPENPSSRQESQTSIEGGTNFKQTDIGRVECTFSVMKKRWDSWQKQISQIIKICSFNRLTLRECKQIVDFFLFLGPHYRVQNTQIISALIVFKEDNLTGNLKPELEIYEQFLRFNKLYNPRYLHPIGYQRNMLSYHYKKFRKRQQNEIQKMIEDTKKKSNKCPEKPTTEDTIQETQYTIALFMLKECVSEKTISGMVDALYSQQKLNQKIKTKNYQLQSKKKYVAELFPK